MIRFLSLNLMLCAFLLAGCGDSVQPEKTAGAQEKPYEKNAMDTVGVAEGDKQVSPFGKPAH
jgi:hypothetical protein